MWLPRLVYSFKYRIENNFIRINIKWIILATTKKGLMKTGRRSGYAISESIIADRVSRSPHNWPLRECILGNLEILCGHDSSKTPLHGAG